MRPGDRRAVVAPGAQHNGFPGLARTSSGRLVAMWRRAAAHGRGHRGVLVASTSDDGGVTWSSPVVKIEHPTLDYRDVGLSYLDEHDALVAWFFADDTTRGCGAFVSWSHDEGATWTAPLEVGFDRGYSTYASGHVVTCPDGTLVAAGYGADTQAHDAAGRWSVRVVRATSPESREIVTVVESGAGEAYSETVLGHLPDGRLAAMIRRDAPLPAIFLAVSPDQGVTWGPPRRVSAVPASGRPGWVTTHDGRIVLMYRRLPDRSAVVVTSADGGLTWSAPVLLDGVAAYQSAYQQAVQVAPGVLGVVYAEETGGSNAAVRFRYLTDGHPTPLGDEPDGFGLAPSVVVPAGQMSPSGQPAPTAAVVGNTRTWSFAPASPQHIVATVGALDPDWRTVDVYALWTVANPGGSVRWDSAVVPLGAGNVVGAAGTYSTMSARGVGQPGQVQRTLIARDVPRVQGAMSVRVVRVASSDLNTGPAHLVGIEIERSS